MDGCFDALATCHLECLCVEDGSVVSTKSVLEANNSQEDREVSRSKLGKVFRSEGPRHSPVYQRLNIRAFKLSGAVVPSYKSGPNRLRHACVRRTRPSISNERSPSSWMIPPW